MENKREVSALIPYKVVNNIIFVFLQKRDKNTKILPDHFAFFGGKIEKGETPTQALEREIKEELCFLPLGYEFLGQYHFPEWLANIYFVNVGEDFEQKIKIMEGEYGKFFSESDVIKEPMIISGDKGILKDLYKKINHA